MANNEEIIELRKKIRLINMKKYNIAELEERLKRCKDI